MKLVTLLHPQLLLPNVQMIKSGMIVVLFVVTFSAARTKNVFQHPVPLDVTLVVSALRERTQVQTTLIYA